MIVKKNEFSDSIKTLGDLYEEGKDCLNSLSILEDEHATYSRLFDILKEMRDLSAINMKKLHVKNDN